MTELVKLIDIIRYEVSSHWLASYVSNKYLQGLMANYIVWRVTRKYGKYKRHIQLKNNLEQKGRNI